MVCAEVAFRTVGVGIGIMTIDANRHKSRRVVAWVLGVQDRVSGRVILPGATFSDIALVPRAVTVGENPVLRLARVPSIPRMAPQPTRHGVLCLHHVLCFRSSHRHYPAPRASEDVLYSCRVLECPRVRLRRRA